MNRTKEVMKEKGIKPTWLDKSYNMVNAYVQNKQHASLEILYEIANVLEIDVKNLLKPNNVAK